MPDYTKQRKSKIIQVCPNCGRKGKRGRVSTSKSGKTYAMYDHVTRLQTVAGITFNTVEDYCTVEETKNAPA